jgi:hypothetical protein
MDGCATGRHRVASCCAATTSKAASASARRWAATDEGGHRELPLDTVECAVAAGLRRQRRGVSDVREGDGAARCGSAPGPAAGDAERGGVARAVGTRPAGQRDGCDLSLTCGGGVLWTRRGVSSRAKPTINLCFARCAKDAVEGDAGARPWRLALRWADRSASGGG